MTDRIENARAAREAREATVRRAAGGPRATEDALKRYLAAESFHERRREDQSRDEAASEEDERER